MKKILVVSTIPATSGIGGVTIHTQRLLESSALASDSFLLILFDYKKSGIREYVKVLEDCDAVHIHISNPLARLMFVSLAKARGKKVILTVHGNLGRHGAVKNHFDNLAVRLSDLPILINQKSYEKARVLNSGSVLLPAFIPPQKSERLPDSIIKLIDGIDRNTYGLVFVTNASHRNFDEAGNEIYGIDFLIKAFAEIKDKFLIVSDPSGDYSKIYSLSVLPKNVAIISELHSFFEVLAKCDGMIRATSTDGDAISLKEALFLSKRVIATDCVDRPSGISLFHYNDTAGLLKALADAHSCGSLEVEDAIPSLKAIYQNI